MFLTAYSRIRSFYSDNIPLKSGPHALPTCPHTPQVCSHTPRTEWVRVLSASADIAWSGYARTAAPSPPSSSTSSLRSTGPDMVLMPSGEEVAIGNDNNDGGGNDSFFFEQYVQPLPAQCLSALSRAALMWGMPTDEAWLGRYLEVGACPIIYMHMKEVSFRSFLISLFVLDRVSSLSLQCIYLGLSETQRVFSGLDLGSNGGTSVEPASSSSAAANRQHFLPGEMTDLLWALIMSGVRPDPEWMRAYMAASQAVLQVRFPSGDVIP